MRYEDAYMGQKVTWVRQFPWPAIHATIQKVYSWEARIRYYRGHPHYDHVYVYASLKKLVPGHITGMNDEELRKLINPRYKRKPKVRNED